MSDKHEVFESDLRKLASMLSTLLDWDSEDLEQDFIAHARLVTSSFSEDQLRKILHDYESLHPTRRDSPEFDMDNFLRKHFSSVEVSVKQFKPPPYS